MKKNEKQTFNTKMYEVCGDDELRPVMQCVYFDCGYAYATNGHIVIKQTLAFQSVLLPENLDGKLLHRESWKAAMNFDVVECTSEGIECWSENGQKAFFEFYKIKENEKLINFESAMKRKGLTTLGFIGINPEMLMRLSKALYDPNKNMRLQFTGIDSAILVDVPGIDDQEAHIMPVIINASLF